MAINHNPLINHLIYKPRKKGLDGKRIPTNKAQSRNRRAVGVCQSKEYDDFLIWITGLQEKLNLTDDKFARLLGISVRSLYRYKGRTGVLPSIKVWNILKSLDKVTQLNGINIIRMRISIRGR
jgi:hypothetical protein